MGKNVDGNIKEFDKNWNTRNETSYSHYLPLYKKVVNQIQFAFRQHFLLFQDQINKKVQNNNMKFCELGCGRGTLSAYFAEKGYECTLIDSSKSILENAKTLFSTYGYRGNFKESDVLKLSPKLHNQFSVVASIGLCEHFTDIKSIIKAHDNILSKGGKSFCYIVPRDNGDVQNYFNFTNKVLNFFQSFNKNSKDKVKKTKVFRNGYFSQEYIKAFKDLKINEYSIVGLYPYPMISYSIDFPFTLTNSFFEKIIVKIFYIVRFFRGNNVNHWMCKNENFGNAILVTWTKK